MTVHLIIGTHWGERSWLLKLELQVVVSYSMWVLSNKLWSSAEVYVLNHWAISLIPLVTIFFGGITFNISSCDTLFPRAQPKAVGALRQKPEDSQFSFQTDVGSWALCSSEAQVRKLQPALLLHPVGPLVLLVWVWSMWDRQHFHWAQLCVRLQAATHKPAVCLLPYGLGLAV